MLPWFLLLLGFGIWYIYYSFECFLNGASIDRNEWLMAFSCWWQEVAWNVLPGGLNRKAKFIREIVDVPYNGCISGFYGLSSWRYNVVREHDLYKACANDVLPGRIHFVCTHVVLPLLPWSIWALIHWR